MARVRKDSHASVASGSARHKEAGRATPSYKVVLEQLTRERKLKTLVCSQVSLFMFVLATNLSSLLAIPFHLRDILSFRLVILN